MARMDRSGLLILNVEKTNFVHELALLLKPRLQPWLAFYKRRGRAVQDPVFHHLATSVPA